MSSLRDALRKIRKKTLKPPTKMNLVEWADSHRMLSKESSSEPGKWRTDRVEPARGPMLAVTDPAVRKITVQCCTQLMKTELINNIVGYHIHQDPCPMIVMQPTKDFAEDWGEERLDPMIRDTPVLNELVREKKSRDSGNTKEKKMFPGGYVAMVGANSPTKLASRPVRIVLCDEIDKYPSSAGKEGDPVKLISERSATFWNSKIIHVCSPTIEGDSRINEEYKKSDQRIYKVPCPHCGESQEMTWDHVKWEEGRPEEALYYCFECGEGWTESQRIRAIGKGEWEATKPFRGHAGFKVSKLASPWETVAQLAAKYEDSKDDPDKMKTFMNTQLAETYKESGDVPEWKTLYRRRENYKIGEVPMAGIVLTLAADVQKDRIEFEVVAWCRGKRTYSVEYKVLEGDTSKDEVWDSLEECIWNSYKHESGREVSIFKAAIDTGYRTSEVYKFCRRFPPGKVYAIKGAPGLATPIGTVTSVDVKDSRGRRDRRGLKLWMIGVDVLKSEVYTLLRKEEPLDGESFPNGYCHFPEYDQEFFQMLTAEELREEKDKRRRTRYVWHKIRERNEALDCRVYNLFLSYVIKMNKFKDHHWDKLEAEMGSSPPSSRRMESPEIKQGEGPKQKIKLKRKSSSWL